MKKLVFLLALAAIPILTVTSPAPAQDTSANMAYVVAAEPMPAHASAFEEGARQHMEWVGEEGGSWTWAAFEIAFGERTGQYFFFSGGHTYADFDQPDVDPVANAESIDRNVAPHVENVVAQLIRLRPDLSMLGGGAALSPLYEVVTFQVNPGYGPEWVHFLERLKTALEGASVPLEYLVFQGAQGGTLGEWVVSIPHENFASMSGPAEFDALLEQAFGEFESQSLLGILDEAIASSTNEIFVLRPDLSLNLGN